MEAFTINLAVFFSAWFLIFIGIKIWFFLKKIKKSSTKNQTIIPKVNFIFKANSEQQFQVDVDILQLTFSNYKKNKVAFNYDPKPGHALIVGGSGSGKSEKYFKPEIIFNGLLEQAPNMIVSDLKGDQSMKSAFGSFESLFLETETFLKSKGFNVYKLDLIGNDLQEKTLHYNVLNVVFDSKNNATLLDKNIKMLLQQLFPLFNTKDKYWIDSSRLIVESIIYYMIAIEIPKENFNLQALIKVWQNFHEYIKYYEKYEKNKQATTNPNQAIIDLIQTSLNLIKSKSFLEVAASINVELRNFNKGLLKNISSKHDFDAKSFHHNKSVLFVQTNGQTTAYSNYASLVIKQIIDSKNSFAPQKKLMVLLDEFNNIGYYDDLSFYLDCMRSQKVYFCLGIQSIKKFELKYGSINQYANNFNISYLFGSTTNKEELEYFNGQKHYQIVTNKNYTRFNRLSGKSKQYQPHQKINDNHLQNNQADYVWIKRKHYHLQKTNLDFSSKLHELLF